MGNCTPTIELNEVHQGRTFDVTNSSLILIKLKENPSTGYRWIVNSFDDSIIKVQGSNYSADSDNGLGGSGVHAFTFEAKSLGTTSIHLELERSWEKSNAIKHFEVTLIVK